VIEGVFGVDVAGAGAVLLGLGDDRQGQGGLADAFRPVDLGDPALGDAAHAQGQVEGETTGGDGCHRGRAVVQGGGDTGAEVAVDLGQHGIEVMGWLWWGESDSCGGHLGWSAPSGIRGTNGSPPVAVGRDGHAGC
jgi:hypothetical protein